MGDAMKRILLAGVALLALTAAQPTLAADAPVYKGPAPVAVALFNWSGFYVGAQAGYGWGNTNRTYTDGYSPPTLNINGWVLGGYLGYNFLVSPSFLLGIEGDINWASVRGSGFDPVPVYNLSAEAKWLGSIRGRLGFAADRALFFVTGGWAWANYDHFISAPAVTFNGTHDGWTMGGGLEWAFANNILGRVEYRYYDFARKNYPASAPWLPHNFKPTLQTVTVGAAIKF